MRWMLLALVAANMAYFAWVQSKSSQASGGEALVSAVAPLEFEDVPKLQLTPESRLGSERVEWPSMASSTPVLGADCWLVGPFSEKITAKQVLFRFWDQGASAKLLVHAVEGEPGFVLRSDPAPSASDGTALVKRLQLAGFANAQLTVQAPGSDYRAELGHYDSLRAGQSAQRDLAAAGFVFDLMVQRGETKKLYVQVILEAEQVIPLGFWQEMDSDFTMVPRQQNWCGPIASVD